MVVIPGARERALRRLFSEVVQLPAYLRTVIGVELFDARIFLTEEGLLGPGVSSTLDFPHG